MGIEKSSYIMPKAIASTILDNSPSILLPFTIISPI
jgi:hypothetical protein